MFNPDVLTDRASMILFEKIERRLKSLAGKARRFESRRAHTTISLPPVELTMPIGRSIE